MEENLELEQELDTEYEDIEVENETEDLDLDGDDESEEEEFEESSEDELEYDEDGNVIEAEATEQSAETVNENVDESNTVNENNKEYDSLKKKYDDREALIRDALKSVGIDEKDLDQGLAKLAADAEGVGVDEYLKKRAETMQAEEAKKYYEQMLLDRMVEKDMKELHSLFPETKDITKFENVPNVKRYAELRDLGLSVAEAYNAANPGVRREAIASSVRQQSINASKSHLKSTVPIAAKDTSIKISRSDMQQMRDLFPDKSDKEIIALYKKTI